MCWQNMFFENTDYSYDKHDEASVSSQLLYTDFMKSETVSCFLDLERVKNKNSCHSTRYNNVYINFC